MYLKFCKNNREFVETYREYLIKYETEMVLFFKNLKDLDIELGTNQIRGGVWENDTLKLIFLNAFPYKLQILSIDKDLQAFDLLANYINLYNIEINGCQGDMFDSQQFINSFTLITGRVFKIHLSMDILKLEALNEYAPKGKLLYAKDCDYSIIFNAAKNFVFDAIGDKLTDEENTIYVERLLKNPDLYVYQNEEGVITSTIQTSETSPHNFSISLVYTFNEYRNKGYAKSMVYLLCQKILKRGHKPILFVDKKNPISNKVYEDIGFNKVIDNYDCILLKETKTNE